ncbi:MAG: hypothetical protein R2788_12725 [Saprospiraceae bacterium]
MAWWTTRGVVFGGARSGTCVPYAQKDSKRGDRPGSLNVPTGAMPTPTCWNGSPTSNRTSSCAEEEPTALNDKGSKELPTSSPAPTRRGTMDRLGQRAQKKSKHVTASPWPPSATLLPDVQLYMVIVRDKNN